MTWTQVSIWSILGILPLLFLPRLPTTGSVTMLLIAAVVIGWLPIKGSAYISLLLFAFCWAVWQGQTLMRDISTLTQHPVTVEARVISHDAARRALTLHVIALRDGPQLFPPVYARVYYQQNQGWCSGQQWQMQLSLRPVHALLNEGGYDAQRFAVASRKPLTGRVTLATALDTQCNWRERIIQRAEKHYTGLHYAPLLRALAFGERDLLSADIRKLLRDTGTAHLMAISGMHIGLAAGFGAMLGRFMQLMFPARHISYRWPLFWAMLFALAYTGLSGSQPPAMRALFATGFWLGIKLAGINITRWQVWLYCVAALLVSDPLTVLSDSFWLSVLAVATLFAGYQFFPLPPRFLQHKRWWIVRLIHLQLLMTLLFVPLQILIFNGISYTALLANLWAIPLITLVTVPAILLGLLSLPWPALSAMGWKAANLSLAWTLVPLQHLPEGWITVSRFALLMAVCAGGIIFAFRFTLWRYLAATLCASAWLVISWRESEEQPVWQMDMLDVGHGLAVVITKDRHSVLYDAGGRWEGGDAGERIIAPWLRWQGITPEQLILSHAHLDHRGGAESLRKQWPAMTERNNFSASPVFACHQGEQWVWRGLQFKVLYPPQGMTKGGNNDSCVLLIEAGPHRVLLTGDMERSAEQYLLTHGSIGRPITVLQVPHHGSNTSSIAPLLRRLQGEHALASAARFSPWRLPAKKVIQRYKHAGYQWWDTAQSGQIHVDFFSNQVRIKGLREQILPRWYHQWFGVPRDSR
ncbi:DNA internalization-related competence protein ComEC/Rec2 [Enterobacterales bacterium CwR94]|nr:DNA internalization-related competence protein ComEC/Rec2 [Enterobacterales bacterium CwR94]